MFLCDVANLCYLCSSIRLQHISMAAFRSYNNKYTIMCKISKLLEQQERACISLCNVFEYTIPIGMHNAYNIQLEK